MEEGLVKWFSLTSHLHSNGMMSWSIWLLITELQLAFLNNHYTPHGTFKLTLCSSVSLLWQKDDIVNITIHFMYRVNHAMLCGFEVLNVNIYILLGKPIYERTHIYKVKKKFDLTWPRVEVTTFHRLAHKSAQLHQLSYIGILIKDGSIAI